MKNNSSVWYTPTGHIYKLYIDMLLQDHLLIAGATGSGKSVILNGMISTALYNSPTETKLILIDPKRVELNSYKQLPHVISYASENDDIIKVLHDAINIMENRYKRMEERREKLSSEPHIYIIVDEFADLMTTCKKAVLPMFCRLAQLGRASKIHLVLATQRPTVDIINGQIKVNINSRIALRCPTAQDSRNIIERNGAEKLPLFGWGYYLKPCSCELHKIPKVDDDEIQRLIDWWEIQYEKPSTPIMRWFK